MLGITRHDEYVMASVTMSPSPLPGTGCVHAQGSIICKLVSNLLLVNTVDLNINQHH